MDLLIEPLRNQFLGLFFRFCYFFLFLPNFPFLCYFIYFYYLLLLLFSLLFHFFSLSIFSILTSFALVSTTYYTLLGTLSSLSLLFSSWFQDCDELAIAFPKLHFTFVFQSCQFLFSLYVSGNKYSFLPYAQ